MSASTKQELTVTIGGADDGEQPLTLGGAADIPLGSPEERPDVAVCMEVWDTAPGDWPGCLTEDIGGSLDDPVEWAKALIDKVDPDAICLRLAGSDPALEGRSPEECAEVAKRFAGEIDLPLVVVGDGSADRETEVIPVVAEALAGRRCLIGTAEERNYRTLATAAQAFDHCLLAETPIDMNLAKQLNILIEDTGLPLDRIVMHHLTSGLGYGLEYTYSIMERSRQAALRGDDKLAQPMAVFIGPETWRTKEARASADDQPEWGDQSTRATLWESVAAAAYALAGASLLVFRSPSAACQFRQVWD
ncbi:MAG: acetyl-CoA decarbonylase/synthase complex subunit delta [Armatimonadia bacterium]|nr:acetyl-CoA decarbonylase/synthase complex subunit delta [Armatimonadia bacterium]